MTCITCKYEWCWVCGGDWRNAGYTHFRGEGFRLISCRTYEFIPDTCCRKTCYWLTLIGFIIISPLLSLICGIAIINKWLGLHKLIGTLRNCYSCIGKILAIFILIPWNLIILLLMLTVGLIFGVLALPVIMPMIIYQNVKMFSRIMSYWSTRNRRKKGNLKFNEEYIQKIKKQE